MLPSGGWNELKWACVEWVLVFSRYECVFVNGFFLCEVLHTRTKTITEQVSLSVTHTHTHLFFCHHGRSFPFTYFIYWANDKHIPLPLLFPTCLQFYWTHYLACVLSRFLVGAVDWQNLTYTLNSGFIEISYLNLF